MKVKLWLVLAALICTNAHAQLFKIINRSNNGAIATAAFNALETAVNRDLPNVDTGGFAEAMANAGVMAAVGIGADYASDFDTIVLGANFGAGVDVGNGSLSDISADNAGGIGVAGSLLLGTRLDRWTSREKLWFFEADRTKVFFNLNFFDPPDVSDELKVENKSLGFRLQYKWVKPKQAAWGIFKWSGVDLTTGLQYTKFDLTITQNINETIAEQGASGTFNGTASIGAKVTTLFVPVELTTGGRLLYLLNVYTGVGVDVAFGSTESVANVTGPVSLSGAVTATGTANLDLGQKEGPALLNPRLLVGVQLDIPVVKLYAQGNIGADRFGANLGLRFVW